MPAGLGTRVFLDRSAAVIRRKPQINFQVLPHMKMLYDEAKGSGHFVTRFCAAGLLLLVEDPWIRQRAINRLREWEAEYAYASRDEIRDFVQGVRRAMRSGARGTSPARRALRSRTRARRAGSA
jgi:hypothetical protein